MRYCEACKVSIEGSIEYCPLCQSRLSGEPEEDSYPILLPGRKPYRLLVRILAMVTVIAAVVCAVVNFSLPGHGWWSLFVVAGLASAWLSLGMTIRRRRNPMKGALWHLGLVSVLLLLWDWFTGRRGWSVHFVLPVFYSCMQCAVAIAAWVLRLRPSDYMLYLLLCVLAGFIPLILLLCGLLQIMYPSAICGGISVIFLAALLLFKGSALKNELVRRLHL